MTRIEAIAALAALMNLTPAVAVALPTVLTVAAGKVGMTEAAMIEECIKNQPLRAYLAQACATAIKSL